MRRKPNVHVNLVLMSLVNYSDNTGHGIFECLLDPFNSNAGPVNCGFLS